jgi:hypothetical protein
MKLLSLLPLLTLMAFPQTVYAHGFGERYDLPVPLWLYLLGAGITVALSFVMAIAFIKRKTDEKQPGRMNLLNHFAGKILIHSASIFTLQLLGLVVFFTIIFAGVFGNPNPSLNISPTIIWVIWWVGFAYVSALIGNIWAAINPWNTLYAWTEHLFNRVAPDKQLSLNRAYPTSWGVWPAILLFFAFAWFELAYPTPAIPYRITQSILIYSVITWMGMAIFGRAIWLHHGEVFSMVFTVLAKFAPTQVSVTDTIICNTCPLDCQNSHGRCIDCWECFAKVDDDAKVINLLPHGTGLMGTHADSSSMVIFVVLLLSTVTFDGLMATTFYWEELYTPLFQTINDATTVITIGLTACLFVLLGAYLITISLIRKIAGGKIRHLAKAFVFTLVPIALAYHLAHYFSFLIIQGQNIIPLLSDPFGLGWNLFGTSDFQINIGLVGARFAWLFAVAVIVIGHVIAVYLSHHMALQIYQGRRNAIKSQYPMLLLMVGYTVLSLWILSQPIVEP